MEDAHLSISKLPSFQEMLALGGEESTGLSFHCYLTLLGLLIEKKRHQGYTRTEERPREDTERRPSARQGEGLGRSPTHQHLDLGFPVSRAVNLRVPGLGGSLFSNNQLRPFQVLPLMPTWGRGKEEGCLLQAGIAISKSQKVKYYSAK